MKRIFLSFAATVAVFAGLPLAFASPFDLKNVPAEPATVVHFDCDLIQASALGQAILSQPDLQDRLASAGKLFDVDFRKQLHGVTMYSTVAHPQDWIVVAAADFDPDKLLAKAQTLNDFYGITNGSHVVYTWLDDKSKRREGLTPRVYGAISGHHLVMGPSEERVADAVDVLEGATPSLENLSGFPSSEYGESVLMEAAMLKIDVGDNARGPGALLKLAESANLKVSEAHNNTTAAVRLETADEDSATQINNIAQGFLGMLKMRGGDTNAVQFANSLKITQDDSTVALTLSMPSSVMVDMMKDAQKKGGQRRANRRARDGDSQQDKAKSDDSKDSRPENK